MPTDSSGCNDYAIMAIFEESGNVMLCVSWRTGDLEQVVRIIMNRE